MADTRIEAGNYGQQTIPVTLPSGAMVDVNNINNIGRDKSDIFTLAADLFSGRPLGTKKECRVEYKGDDDNYDFFRKEDCDVLRKAFNNIK